MMARNHRGFVESLIAANRIGADVLLLNTSFAGPALAEVISREGVDAVVYDEEFTSTVDTALVDAPDAVRIVAWTGHRGRRPDSRDHDRRALRAAAPPRRGQVAGHPADLGYDGNTQGRQPLRRQPD